MFDDSMGRSPHAAFFESGTSPNTFVVAYIILAALFEQADSELGPDARLPAERATGFFLFRDRHRSIKLSNYSPSLSLI